MEDIFTQEGQNWREYQLFRISDLQKSGLYDEAMAVADESLKVWVDDPVLLFYKSLILLDLQLPGEAIRVLRKIQSVIPFDMRIQDYIGKNLMLQGYYYTALKTLSHFDVMSIGSAGESSLTLHVCRFFTGDTQEAEKFCDLVLGFHTDDEQYGEFLATFRALKILCLLTRGEEKEAQELSGLIVESYPDCPLVAYAAGISARAVGDLDHAVMYLKKAVEVQPLDMRARSDLADVLMHLGKIEEGMTFRQSITGFFGAEESDPWPGLRGEELLMAGRFEEACLIYKRICEEDPDNPEFLIPFITALHFSGKYDQAIVYAEKADHNPKAWKAIYLKAASLYQQGKVIESFQCICSAGARDRGFIFYTLFGMEQEGWFKTTDNLSGDALAFQVMIQDGLESAIPLFEALSDAHPDIPEYHAILVLLYSFTCRYVDAVLASDNLEGHDNPDFALIRILAIRTAGCLNDAEMEGKKILDKYPDYPAALNMYTRILLEQERYREGYTLLLSQNPPVIPDANLQEVYVRCLIRAGSFHDASIAASLILTENRGRPLDYSLLIRSFMLEGDYSAALFAVREGILTTGASQDLFLPYVKALLQTGNPDEAAGILQDQRAPLPNTPEVRYLKSAAAILSGNDEQDISVPEYAAHVFQAENGTLRTYIGDYLTAARMLEIEIFQEPLDYSLRIAYAGVLFKMERYSEGMHQLSLIPDHMSSDEQVQMLLKEGSESLCLETGLADLVRLGGDSLTRQVELIHERATRLKDFGIDKLAIEACRWIINQTTKDTVIHRFIADAFHMLGDLEENPDRFNEALSVYNELLAEDPDNIVLLTEKGLILNNLNRFGEAETILQKAVELNPLSGFACSALCWSLSCLEKNEEALELGNRAVSLIPHIWASWNNRGMAKFGLGNFEDAASDFRQAIRCLPSEKIGRLGLLATLMELESDDAPDVYGDLIVRFGNINFSRDEYGNDDNDEIKNPSGRRRVFETVAGYMDGYL